MGREGRLCDGVKMVKGGRSKTHHAFFVWTSEAAKGDRVIFEESFFAITATRSPLYLMNLLPLVLVLPKFILCHIYPLLKFTQCILYNTKRTIIEHDLNKFTVCNPQ